MSAFSRTVSLQNPSFRRKRLRGWRDVNKGQFYACWLPTPRNTCSPAQKKFIFGTLSRIWGREGIAWRTPIWGRDRIAWRMLVQSLVSGTSWALIGFVGSRGSIEKVHRLRCQGTRAWPFVSQDSLTYGLQIRSRSTNIPSRASSIAT